MVDRSLAHGPTASFDIETLKRVRESYDAFESGRLMLGGIYKAQDLAEDVLHSTIPISTVADRSFGVCDSSGIPRSGIQRSSV